MFYEGLLQRMERAGSAEALDRGDLAAFLLHSESQAGIDARAVDENSAGAARA
jgi:hypothetical protein